MFVELVDVGAKSTPERPPRTRLVHPVSRFSGFCEGPERDGGWGPSPERLSRHCGRNAHKQNDSETGRAKVNASASLGSTPGCIRGSRRSLALSVGLLGGFQERKAPSWIWLVLRPS